MAGSCSSGNSLDKVNYTVFNVQHTSDVIISLNYFGLCQYLLDSRSVTYLFIIVKHEQLFILYGSIFFFHRQESEWNVL